MKFNFGKLFLFIGASSISNFVYCSEESSFNITNNISNKKYASNASDQSKRRLSSQNLTVNSKVTSVNTDEKIPMPDPVLISKNNNAETLKEEDFCLFPTDFHSTFLRQKEQLFLNNEHIKEERLINLNKKSIYAAYKKSLENGDSDVSIYIDFRLSDGSRQRLLDEIGDKLGDKFVVKVSHYYGGRDRYGRLEGKGPQEWDEVLSYFDYEHSSRGKDIKHLQNNPEYGLLGYVARSVSGPEYKIQLKPSSKPKSVN